MEKKLTVPGPAEIKSISDQPTLSNIFPIDYAALHTAIRIPGFLVPTTSLSTDKASGIEMKFCPAGLMINYKGDTVIIPSANIISMRVMK